MDFSDVLRHDDTFRYRLLSRMKSDCEYYLGNGARHPKHLWAGDEVKQIAYMKALWNSFGEGDKPEWLSFEQILEYEQKIGIPAILVEMGYKGYYKRFALTAKEFEKEFPDTYDNFGPIKESNSDTLKPFVHIWFEPCIVGDDKWVRHFTDMLWGLPEGDIEAIENGNVECVPYVSREEMRSLDKYIEDVAVYRCRAVFQHDNLPFAEQEIKTQILSADNNFDYSICDFVCVEENKAEVNEDFPDDCIFTFEFSIKMPCDSITDINKILNVVDGGELLGMHYERSDEKDSLKDKILSAEAEKAVRGVGAARAEREPER